MRPDLRRWTRPELEHAVRLADRQRTAALALHQPLGGTSCCGECCATYPCPTARALGVDDIPSSTPGGADPTDEDRS